MKFKHKVIPGDTLIVRCELTEPIRRSIVMMYCQTFVGEKLVAEGEMTAQVMKNKSARMISALAHIDPAAQIGASVTVEPFAYIQGDVELIGDGTWIGPHAVIYDGARIGKNCRIFNGASVSAIRRT